MATVDYGSFQPTKPHSSTVSAERDGPGSPPVPLICVLRVIPQYHQIALIAIHPVMGLSREAAGNIKGRMFMMDGQLFKEKHHRVLDGRDPNQDGCDVTRQTGTSFSSCRDVKQGET
ncbi:hypothetical protein INR49_030107 [Caranx melampygus]|nr:hypothetical protein INR49_030107 [Caranx melampygus]